MREKTGFVVARLLLGMGLFLLYIITAESLPEFTVLLFLGFLVLLQGIAYVERPPFFRFILAFLSLAILFLLSMIHPLFFPALTVVWLYEIMQKESYVQTGFLLLVFVTAFVMLVVKGYLQADLRDLGFLLVATALLAALRHAKDIQRKQDERILSLTRSTRNLELEQKRIEAHTEQLRRLYTLEERNRLSRDLHDSVGHTLSAIRIQLEAIAQIAQTDGERAAGMARNLARYSEEGLQRLRNLLHEMKPPRYSDQALTMQCMRIAEDFTSLGDMQVNVTVSRYMYPTPPAQDRLLQFALQEFLSNAGRHGKASQVNIHLQYSQKGLVVTMKDNGVGSTGFTKNIGIRGIEERTRAEGGTVEIHTASGAGFTIQIALPKGAQG